MSDTKDELPLSKWGALSLPAAIRVVLHWQISCKSCVPVRRSGPSLVFLRQAFCAPHVRYATRRFKRNNDADF